MVPFTLCLFASAPAKPLQSLQLKPKTIAFSFRVLTTRTAFMQMSNQLQLFTKMEQVQVGNKRLTPYYGQEVVRKSTLQKLVLATTELPRSGRNGYRTVGSGGNFIFLTEQNRTETSGDLARRAVDQEYALSLRLHAVSCCGDSLPHRYRVHQGSLTGTAAGPGWTIFNYH